MGFAGGFSRIVFLSVVPFLCGLLVSSKIAPIEWIENKVIELAGAEKKEIQDEGINERQLEVENDSPTALDVKSVSVFDQIIGADDDPFLAVAFELHLNGEASACVTTNPSITSLSQGA